MAYDIECVHVSAPVDSVYVGRWGMTKAVARSRGYDCVMALQRSRTPLEMMLMRLHRYALQEQGIVLSCHCPVGAPCRREWLAQGLVEQAEWLRSRETLYEATWPRYAWPAHLNSSYDWIENRPALLAPELIYVFGSNTLGLHGKGAALEALSWYGAVMGRGEGPMGRSYAIPTKDAHLRPLPREVIGEHVQRFLEWQYSENKMCFLTAVGCGLAGYATHHIAPFFNGIRQAWVPRDWYPYLL